MSKVLEVRNVTKIYPGVVALDNVSFDVEKGEILALIGENGAGKSTVIKTIAGAIQPEKGTIVIDGKEYQKLTPSIAKEAGIDEVIAGVLPEGKEEQIRKLKEEGKVAMVGDGINDAPALTSADIGIAIGAGTDIAIDAADVVLMRSSLGDVYTAIRLSGKTYKNIIENLFWALFYNTLLIPLAAGAYIHFFGLVMEPVYGAAAMSMSSICVVLNALRLNLFKE